MPGKTDHVAEGLPPYYPVRLFCDDGHCARRKMKVESASVAREVDVEMMQPKL